MWNSPILEQQKNSLEKEDLGRRILASARNELYLKLKLLDLALGRSAVFGGAGGAGRYGRGGALFYAGQSDASLSEKPVLCDPDLSSYPPALPVLPPV